MYTPFGSVLSEGFTDRDASAPIITAREGIRGLRDAYFVEKLQEIQIKENNKGIS